MRRTWIALLVLPLTVWSVLAADPPDLAEYRTVEKAITTRISRAAPAAVGQTGYLGVQVALEKGKVVVVEAEPLSPAAKAGVQRGDGLVSLDGQALAHAEALRDFLLGKSAGDAVKLSLIRQDKPMELSVVLGATCRPMKLSTERTVLGLKVEEAKDSDGAVITQVSAGSPAEKAGLEVGDHILKIDGAPLNTATKLADAITERKPGDVISLTLRWNKKEVEMKVTLAGEAVAGGGGKTGGWDNRLPNYWRKDVYRLAVIAVEYPDAKHNPKISRDDWEKSLFSTGTYTGKGPSGNTVYGSLNDYYKEISYDQLKVEGKMFDWVEVSKKRSEYAGIGSTNRSALLTDALDKVIARDGKDALKDYDGVFFLYAGDRVSANRGDIYWPHRATFTHQGKRWAYFIVPEGGNRMTNISVICHEFGHMLGLPDLYARPENPGSEGVGVWCAMSNQIGSGRPQHFSAWCKEQLGWLKPAVIDPTVKQKLVLSPISDSAKECFKVLLRLDGSEYYLLENRRKKGFDTELPADGLLIWRVVNNKPILEESHGIDGPAGPRVLPAAVPYPSQANSAFTPFTTPSSRAQLGGGLPVHITNIRKLPDGRITFHVGYEYY